MPRSHWSSIMHNLDSLKGRGKVAGPGHWNDPDFLEVGVEGMALTPTSSQQTLDENQAHMSMWCITSAPLIAGLRMAAGGPGGSTANQTALDILTVIRRTAASRTAATSCPSCASTQVVSLRILRRSSSPRARTCEPGVPILYAVRCD
jgi:hypothetical protein